jgi:flagellar basal-body rod modification protein FlgD
MTVSTSNAVSSPAVTTPAAATAASNSVASQDSFLKLLVTQLQNQDPLNPMDNAQITSQLAQISTVTGVNNLNTTLQQLVTNDSTNQMLSATNMIGHNVLVPGSATTLNQGQAVFGVNLPGAADNVQVTIKDANGNTVHSMSLGSQPAGVLALSWDGTTDSGAAAAPGNYTFSVTATQGSTAVAATTLSSATVQGVVQTATGPQLDLGVLGKVAVSAVAQFL